MGCVRWIDEQAMQQKQTKKENSDGNRENMDTRTRTARITYMVSRTDGADGGREYMYSTGITRLSGK